MKKILLLKLFASILTGGIYEIYWAYKSGKELSSYNKNITDKSILYLILEILKYASILSGTYTYTFKMSGMKIMISLAFIIELIIISLVQNDLNKLVDLKENKWFIKN